MLVLVEFGHSGLLLHLLVGVLEGLQDHGFVQEAVVLGVLVLQVDDEFDLRFSSLEHIGQALVEAPLVLVERHDALVASLLLRQLVEVVVEVHEVERVGVVRPGILRREHLLLIRRDLWEGLVQDPRELAHVDEAGVIVAHLVLQFRVEQVALLLGLLGDDIQGRPGCILVYERSRIDLDSAVVIRRGWTDVTH